MMVIKKQSIDYAEDIVYGWHSRTRGLHIYDKSVIPALKVVIVSYLVHRRKEDPNVADEKATSAIMAWATENEDKDAADPISMESLVQHVEQIIR